MTIPALAGMATLAYAIEDRALAHDYLDAGSAITLAARQPRPLIDLQRLGSAAEVLARRWPSLVGQGAV